VTVEETLKIFAVLKANYSNFFKSMSRIDAEAMVNLWAEMFEDEPYEVVGMAIKSYIASDVNGYPPNVGIIKEQMRKLTKTEGLTEQEAVNLITKACRNGNYGAKEEFDKLPPILKRLVGSPSQIKEWALMDADTFNSVVTSNLMRSYRVMAERERQHQALPSKIQSLITETTNNLRLEGK
jgi:hypothetical protein